METTRSQGLADRQTPVRQHSGDQRAVGIEFAVHHDADYGFIVADAAVRARSFAMVPDQHKFSFVSKAAARQQAETLSVLSRSQPVELRMIETPERFEAVADRLYGPAWGNY